MNSRASHIAQLRWRNVATVGMVAVGTTTLAQRRHGRSWHNYVGATSFSQRCPKVRKLRWANVFLPTICHATMSAMLEKIRSENTCSLIF